MRSIIIFLLYFAAAALCFFLINSRKKDWEIGLSDTVGLSILWPLFLLMVVDWGTGYLFDVISDRIGRLFQKN
ncbi:MAG: hypothetical protein IKR43_03520 [Lachnospiraceae bacterium]|nr:hypothetical protein [Lachnospiraceae bacterium]